MDLDNDIKIMHTICSHVYSSLQTRLTIFNIFSTDNGGKESRYGRDRGNV